MNSGSGAIEAVAGPEAANNAAVGGAYVPLFALGIPFTPAMAMVLGTLMLHGLTPGPNLMKEKADLFWVVIASMYIGNFMLIVLNLPLVNVFVNILRVPQRILMPIIVLLCLIGVYSVNASLLDLLLLAIFGFIGYVLRQAGFQVAPLILALVIGPMIETSLRQALKISGGNLAEVVFRPICLSLYVATLLCFTVPLVLKWTRRRQRLDESPPDARGQDQIIEQLFINKKGGFQMKKSLCVLLAVMFVSAFWGCPLWAAEKYPDKPITLVVPLGTGGMTDITARLLAEKFKAELGQPVLVVNKPGANGLIGIKYALGQPADGYTVIVSILTDNFAAPYFQEVEPLNMKDLSFIGSYMPQERVLFTPPDKPYKTFQEFIRLRQEKPRQNFRGKRCGAVGSRSRQVRCSERELENEIRDVQERR